MLQPRTNIEGKNVEEGTKDLEGTVPRGAGLFGILLQLGTYLQGNTN